MENLHLPDDVALDLKNGKRLASNVDVSNGLVLGLYQFMQEQKTHTFHDLSNFLHRPGMGEILKAKIVRVKSLKSKKRGKYLKMFLNEEFILPASAEQSGPTQAVRALKHTLKQVQEGLRSEVQVLADSTVQKQETIASLREEKKIMKRKLDKRDKKVETLSKKVKDDEEKGKDMAASVKISLQSERDKAAQCKERLAMERRESSIEVRDARRKIEDLAIHKNVQVAMVGEIDQLKKESVKLENVIINKDKEINELQLSTDYLESLLADAKVGDKSAFLFDHSSHSYTPETTMAVLNLIDQNVALERIPKVLVATADLFGKQIVGPVPSEATVRDMNHRRLALSHLHLADILPSKTNTTLLSDETPDRGGTFEGFHIADEDGQTYVVGLREMPNKASKTILNTFQEILSDLDRAKQAGEGNPTVGDCIIANISATMSDQAATQKLFNKMLEELKQNTLPRVKDNWNEMTDDEKDSCSRICNFFCGLHILINLADVTNAALCKFEDATDELNKLRSKCNRGESGTVRLIRTACKALAKRGDEKSGAYGQFSIFINEELHEVVRLEPFYGNRFNILFFDASALFYYKDLAVEFLDKVHGTSNRLLASVLEDLRIPEYLAGVKALGLIEKYVTSPLWRLIEGKSHILEMNVHYSNFLRFLEEASKDASAFMKGEHLPFSKYTAKATDTDSRGKQDPLLLSLISECSIDDTVQQILQMIFTSWIVYMHRAVVDHLPGGEFAAPSESMMASTKSTPKHNKFSESIFGILHHLTTDRPNATILTNEAFIVFSLNKTYNWLEQKPIEERDALLKKAQKLTKEIKLNFKERKEAIRQVKLAALEKSRQAKAKKIENDFRVKEKLTDSILYYGLWQSEETMRIKTESYPTKKEKVEALYSQVQFRKLVLGQPFQDASVFNKSKGGKELTVQKMMDNLSKLIQAALAVPKEPELGTVEPKLPLLVGKNILHTQKCGDEFVKYPGYVIGTVPGYPEWYNVKFEHDTAIYTYDLLKDYKDSCLEITGTHRIMVGPANCAWFSCCAMQIFV